MRGMSILVEDSRERTGQGEDGEALGTKVEGQYFDGVTKRRTVGMILAATMKARTIRLEE